LPPALTHSDPQTPLQHGLPEQQGCAALHSPPSGMQVGCGWTHCPSWLQIGASAQQGLAAEQGCSLNLVQ